MRLAALLAAAAAALAVSGPPALAAPGPAAGSGPPAPVHCPRACMEHLVDQYLQALVRHDPSGLPLSQGVRFTENTEEIRLGEGLWIGASEAPAGFRIYVVDPASSQVAFMGLMKERGRPIQLVLRLKVINGRITEIEHVINRSVRGPALANLTVPRHAFLEDVPAAERTSREDMVNAADDYFEAIEHNDGSLAPFADDCDRHENGMRTTNNHPPVPWPVPLGSPEADRGMSLIGSLGCAAQLDTGVMAFITRLWPRRIEVVDEQKGLVMAFVVFNHRGDGPRDLPIRGVPGVASLPLGGAFSTMQMGELFKVRGGRIHEVEAVGFALPYGARSGWSDYGR